MGAIYLIRHGQASFGRANYDKLSGVGVEQSRTLGYALKKRVPQPYAVFTGRMRRHQETADHCLGVMGVPADITMMAAFDEFDHTEVIKRYKPLYSNQLIMLADLARTLNPRRAFQDMFRQAVERWVGGRYDYQYRETWPQFRKRCRDGIEEVIGRAGPSKQVLVFTSAGAITAIAQSFLQCPDERALDMNWTMTNAGITKIIYGEKSRYLSTLNEHAHFEGRHSDLITYR